MDFTATTHPDLVSAIHLDGTLKVRCRTEDLIVFFKEEAHARAVLDDSRTAFNHGRPISGACYREQDHIEVAEREEGGGRALRQLRVEQEHTYVVTMLLHSRIDDEVKTASD